MILYDNENNVLKISKMIHIKNNIPSFIFRAPFPLDNSGINFREIHLHEN